MHVNTRYINSTRGTILKKILGSFGFKIYSAMALCLPWSPLTSVLLKRASKCILEQLWLTEQLRDNGYSSLLSINIPVIFPIAQSKRCGTYLVFQQVRFLHGIVVWILLELLLISNNLQTEKQNQHLWNANNISTELQIFNSATCPNRTIGISLI